jgi:hypothetical protein
MRRAQRTADTRDDRPIAGSSVFSGLTSQQHQQSADLLQRCIAARRTLLGA